MRRLALALSLASACSMLAVLPAWGQTTSGLQVEVSPGRIDATLGDSFDIVVTVTNLTDQPSSSLVAHIDITDPAQSTSVDPEDWTEDLSQAVGVIPPGESRSATWSLQPISPGSFSLYSVVLSGENAEVQASDATIIEVAFTQTLNPEGVLPVVLAGPIVIAALLYLVIRRGRVRAGGGAATT